MLEDPSNTYYIFIYIYIYTLLGLVLYLNQIFNILIYCHTVIVFTLGTLMTLVLFGKFVLNIEIISLNLVFLSLYSKLYWVQVPNYR